MTVARNVYFYPLPYSEETVRSASKGYALPGVIGERNREINVVTGKTLEGCFITHLVYKCVLHLPFHIKALFLHFVKSDELYLKLNDLVIFE